jgi:NAD(P)-dependent dehydrogenase (short-subunit alcohol dehydrogenase family)
MLEGKVILITGAASGIGAAATALFAGYGARVAMIDRDPEVARRAAELPGAIGLVCDVTDREAVFAAVDAVVRHFGRLDGAFNNAGIEGLDGGMAPTESYPVEAFEQVMAVNIGGTFHCLAAELPRMEAGGSVVNTASVMGWLANPGQSAYVASKHAVIGLTRTAALEQAARGVRVNAVLPGAVATPMLLERGFRINPDFARAAPDAHPMGRIARPEEVAEGAAWLLSDKSSFVTGHTLAIDGGLSAR